jgi:hypothetical protein
LGDLERAGRQLFAATALPTEGDIVRLDLALVSLCRGRDEEALRHYEAAVAHIRMWNPRRRRGPLRVAQLDLQTACRDWDGLGRRPAARQIKRFLAEALAAVPALSQLDSLRTAALLNGSGAAAADPVARSNSQGHIPVIDTARAPSSTPSAPPPGTSTLGASPDSV